MIDMITFSEFELEGMIRRIRSVKNTYNARICPLCYEIYIDSDSECQCDNDW